MLNELQKTEFLFNIHDSNSIITGGRTSGEHYCPVNCVFCICDGDNPGIDSKIPFIEMDELKEGLKFVDWNNKDVYLGDGITKLSAEAFAHPKIYDILEYTCRNLPDHRITIMTTGILIKEDKIDFLNSLKNLNISISVNTLQEEERKKIMPHPETEKVRILLRHLKRVTVQLLDMGDNNILQADINEIQCLNREIKTVQLRRIEHSKFHTEEVIALSKKSINNYDNAVMYLQEHCPNSTYWDPYLKYDLYNAKRMSIVYSYLSNICDFLSKNRNRNYLFCAAESSYNLWKVWLNGFKNVKTILVKNNTYGGSITVAGLLTFDDMTQAVKQFDTTNIQTILLPKVMLNKSFSDLNGKTIVEFEKEIGILSTII